MSSNQYITASCLIGQNEVYKDGQLLLKQCQTDLASFLLGIYQHLELSYPKFYKMDNLSKLGLLAAEVLLKDTFNKNKYQPEQVGVVLANANSSLDADIKYWNSAQDIASPSLFVYTLPNIVVGEICIRNGFKGEDAFYITNSFDAAFLRQQVNYLLEQGVLNACICGWVEVTGENYKAALFLVEAGESGAEFTVENLNRIFEQ